MRIDLNVDFNKDKRVKGCPNVNCEMHKNKKQQDNKNDYCPKCGTKLVYVCRNCFKEIEDNGPSHTICSLCEAKEEEKKQKMINVAKKAGAAAVTTVGAVVLEVAGKVGNNATDVVVHKGVKIADAAVDKIFKK